MSCQAGDIASDVRSGKQGLERYNGGYLELGLSFGYIDNPMVAAEDDDDAFFADFDLGGSYYHNGFFIEASQGTQDGVNIGYTVWNNKNFSVDLLAASINDMLPDRDPPAKNGTEDNRRERKLLGRETIYSGSGIRLTSYFYDYVLQYRLVTDTFAARGVNSTLRIGRGWQVRNWNVHTIVSAQYYSQKTNDYWFGVDSDEASERFPEFEAPATLSYTALIGFTYPISENWVFRSFAGYIQVPDKVQKSPLVSGNEASLVVTTVNYVF